jgi:hypothetical protein
MYGGVGGRGREVPSYPDHIPNEYEDAHFPSWRTLLRACLF